MKWGSRRKLKKYRARYISVYDEKAILWLIKWCNRRDKIKGIRLIMDKAQEVKGNEL